MEGLLQVAVLLLGLIAHSQAQQIVCLADIVLVVDDSGSIRDTDLPGGNNWRVVLDFVDRIAGALDPIGLDATRLGMVTFSNTGVVQFDLDDVTSTREAQANIADTNYNGGNTNTTGGLNVAYSLFRPERGDRPNVEDMIVLITDGNPTRDLAFLPRAFGMIKASGIRIVGVGVTNNIDVDQMRQIVSKPYQDHYFEVNDFAGLNEILDTLITASCRTLRPITPTPTPPKACENTADVLFVLDASGSIGQANFNTIKNFVADLSGELDIDSGRVRVSVMTFSDAEKAEFQLNGYADRTTLKDAVMGIGYTRGRTNTGAALKYMRENTFTSGNGERTDAANIAIVITDGASQDKERTLTEAFLAKKMGIHIITVSIGDWIDREELIGMATYPYEKNMIMIDTVDALDGMREKMRELICNNVNECNSSPCKNGGQCIDSIDMYICVCPSGFAGINCEKECRVGADLVFALDSSGSIGRVNFQKQVDFVKEVVYGLNLDQDTRVGLLTFATSPNARFYMNEYSTRMDVLNALALFYTGGTTNTASAINMMREEYFVSNLGDRSNVDNIGVVMTDGRSNDEVATWTEAMAARAGGIQMLGVGVGQGVKMFEMEGIASAPVANNILRVDTYDQLSTISDQLISAICNEVNECSNGPCSNGGNCLDKINGFGCECTAQYTGNTCDRGCDGLLDLVFAIDSSGSIRNERFPEVLDFAASIVGEIEVRAGKTQVGAVKWSDEGEIQFHLNQYKSQQDVIQALRHIQFVGGRTHTSAALRLMKDDMFTRSNGDRDNAPNVAVIITDGNSNINPELTIPDAIDARVQGIHVIVVAVGTQLNLLELRGMASQPNANTIITVDSIRNLPSVMNNVLDSICNDVNECQSGPCNNGGQCIDTFNRYICMCNGDWSGYNCDRQCSRQLDVTFVLDLSGSVDIVYYNSIAFIREVVEGLPLNFGRTRVGLVSYSDTARINFYLDTYTTREEVLNALSFSLAGGRTNTQEAIKMAYSDVFSSSRGDRGGVPNKMIVLTDGGSNINQANTLSEARNAENLGIEIYSVGIGMMDMSEMNGIATDPDTEHHVHVPDSGSIIAKANELLDWLCA
jgi:collagen type VI alpha